MVHRRAERIGHKRAWPWTTCAQAKSQYLVPASYRLFGYNELRFAKAGLLGVRVGLPLPSRDIRSSWGLFCYHSHSLTLGPSRGGQYRRGRQARRHTGRSLGRLQ